MNTIVSFPDLGTEEATVLEVGFAQGDWIRENQIIVVLESAKATIDVPATKEGQVQEVLIRVGQVVHSGEPILKLETMAHATGELVVALQEISATLSPDQLIVKTDVAKPLPDSAQIEEKALDQVISLPDLGTDTATVSNLLVQEGDSISKDQPVVVLESSKASMEVPAPRAGIVRQWLIHPGQTVQSGDPMFRVELPGLAATALLPNDSKPLTSPISESMQPRSVPDSVYMPSKAGVHAGPAVRRLARELGVDLEKVVGHGPHQRILKEDLKSWVKHQLSAATAVEELSSDQERQEKAMHAEGATLLPLTRIQVISAQRLAQSVHHVVPVTQFEQADITELEAFRQQEKAAAQEKGVSLTVLAFVMKALEKMLRQYPRFNSEFKLDGRGIYLRPERNIGFAVDTEQGLMVPVLKNIQDQSLLDLASRIAELSRLARDASLKPDQMSGASFTVSSLGSVGGTAFTPVINWPQVAILGLSRASIQPIWDGKAFQPRLMLPLSLTYDHRVIDGALAARFLVDLSRQLGDIRRMLL